MTAKQKENNLKSTKFVLSLGNIQGIGFIHVNIAKQKQLRRFFDEPRKPDLSLVFEESDRILNPIIL
jgi:hypothetical protein